MKKNKKISINYIIMPILVALLCGCCVNLLLENNLLKINEEGIDDLINTFLGIWGALLGFIVTAESILIGFKGNENTSIIIESRHYSTVMVLYSCTAIAILIFLLFFSFILIFTKITTGIVSIFVASVVMTGLYVILCLICLFAIIRSALL